jgi:predicted PurR-regulated permease PerM
MTSGGRNSGYPVLAFAVMASIVGWACWKLLLPFLAAIAWAIVLAVAFNRPWTWMERQLPGRRNLAAISMTLLIGVVVVLPAASLATVLAVQASGAASGVIVDLRSRNLHGAKDVLELPPVRAAVEFVRARTGMTAEDLTERATAYAADAATFLAQRTGGFLLSLFDAAMTFLMTLFFLFFFLRDGREMSDAGLAILPIARDRREKIRASLFSMLQTIFRGSLLCALAQGATGALGWWIAGLPSAALAGAAMGFLSLLPIGGTAIVWLPGSAVLWFSGHHGSAVFLAAWGLVVTSFLADNILKPYLIGGTSELNTLVVFVGVFGGLSAFGLLGIFIGPIALALAATLLEVLREANGRNSGEAAPA